MFYEDIKSGFELFKLSSKFIYSFIKCASITPASKPLKIIGFHVNIKIILFCEPCYNRTDLFIQAGYSHVESCMCSPWYIFESQFNLCTNFSFDFFNVPIGCLH